MPSYLETKADEKNREYFATKEASECVGALSQRIDDYFAEMNRTGRINLYRNSYFKFFQGFILKGAIYHSGALGELTNTYVNHYGNLITHVVNMVCQQKLSYDPQATVDDSQAQDQIKLAKGLLYQAANRVDIDLDGKLRLSDEMAEVFGESYVSVLWDKFKGRTLASETDEENGTINEIKEGDNDIQVWTPFDVIIDTTLPSNSLRKWLILRKWENKFEVAARFPKYGEEIRGITVGAHIGDTQLTYSISSETDIIPVYYFFHEKTAALPEGRTIIFVDQNIICADGKLDYREIPLYRNASRELWGSPHGYSKAFDVLPLQESIDRLCSSVLTNELTFSIQNLLIPQGSNIEWEELYGGLNVIEWDSSRGEAGKPSALQLTSTPKEVFDFINMNINWAGILMGVNDAMKGNADLIIKGQASGDALAIMNTNAIQFNSDKQKAHVRLAEQVGTAYIHNYIDFGFPEGVDTERDGMSMSATQKYYRRKWKKSDLDKIDRIMVRYGNPYAESTAGRLQIANAMLQNGKITPDQYFEVMETGNLESQLQSEESQLHLIKEENEAIMDGDTQVPAHWADNHVLHIQEHLAEIANMQSRKNVDAINAMKAHVDQHIQLLKNMDPVLAALMKQPVLAKPPAPAPAAAPKPPTPPAPTPGPAPMLKGAGAAPRPNGMPAVA